MSSLRISNDVDTPPTEKSNRDFPPSLKEVEAILGYKFKDKQLLVQAFTHSSYSVENCISYERLEYIGDSVLNFITTEEQFILYPNMDPGHLTRLRAVNVDTEKLARVAIKHGFYRYMRHQKPLFEERVEEFKKDILEYPLHSNGLIDVPKSLADIVESSIGAVYIDCGKSTDIVSKIFKRILEPRIDPNNIQNHPVTELYEVCQKRKMKIEFQDLWDESKKFNVFINKKFVGSAIYSSKKIAHDRAAKNALDNMENVLNISKFTNEDAIVDSCLCLRYFSITSILLLCLSFVFWLMLQPTPLSTH